MWLVTLLSSYDNPLPLLVPSRPSSQAADSEKLSTLSSDSRDYLGADNLNWLPGQWLGRIPLNFHDSLQPQSSPQALSSSPELPAPLARVPSLSHSCVAPFCRQNPHFGRSLVSLSPIYLVFTAGARRALGSSLCSLALCLASVSSTFPSMLSIGADPVEKGVPRAQLRGVVKTGMFLVHTSQGCGARQGCGSL